MMMTEGQGRRRRARSRAVAALSATFRDAPAPEAAPLKDDGRVRRRGIRCSGVNRGFAAFLEKLPRNAVEVVTVLTSSLVPAKVRDQRLGKCRVCPHVSELDVKGHGEFLHFCVCCPCPAWRLGNLGSDMETKTKFAKARCPKPAPEWVEWQQTDVQ